MLLKLYRILTIAAGPLVDLYLMRRRAAGKEDAERFKERLGYASIARPDGPLVWIHAASVGESISILPLIQALCDTYPKLHVLLTTGTVTSAQMVQSRLPLRAYHQYVPVDRYFSVRRFLKHWQPDLALWVESEIWPNLIIETRKHCQLIMINGRLSQKSVTRWKRYSGSARQLMHCFASVFPQTEHDSQRFETLGAENIEFLGNLKYDAPTLPADSKKMGELLSMIGQRTLWVAASTHPGEEVMAADVHKQLKEEYPDLLTIIIPRHPNRAHDIKEDLTEKFSLNIAIRSQGDSIAEDTDIYLANTMGELGIFYRLATTVFIGGSLVEHGGQNPLEPARLECAIIFGPFMDNFKDIAREMEEKGAGLRVTDVTALRDALNHIFHDVEQQEHMASAAESLAKKKTGVLQSYMGALAPYVEKISSTMRK